MASWIGTGNWSDWNLGTAHKLPYFNLVSDRGGYAMNEIMHSKYAGQMEEVKRRMEVINFVEGGGGHVLYMPTTVELVYLQFRKILELISMASLVANKEAMEKVYRSRRKLASYWNAEKLLKNIDKINSDFYPHPIIENPSSNPKIKSEWKSREGDFLSRNEFVRLYNLCGSLLHANNPFGKEIDYTALKLEIPIWRIKIKNLLNSHTIRLVNDENLYLVHMKEERDDKVHTYTFKRTSDPR